MISYGFDAGDIIETRLTGRIFGQFVQMTFHYKAGTKEPEDDDLTEWLVTFENNIWNGNLENIVSVDLKEVAIVAQTIFPTRKVASRKVAASSSGGIDSPACPPTTAVVCRKLSVLAGARNRGRIYVPGIPFDNTEAGEIQPAFFNAWDVFASTFQDQLVSNARTFIPVIFSTATGVQRAVIADGQADRILRVQRRREIGKGV